MFLLNFVYISFITIRSSIIKKIITIKIKLYVRYWVRFGSRWYDFHTYDSYDFHDFQYKDLINKKNPLKQKEDGV